MPGQRGSPGAVLPDFCGDCGGGKELTMSDLISREALGVGRCNPNVMLDPAYAAGWNGLMNIINNAPAVDAAPVVHGSPVYHNRPARYEHYEMVQQTENGEPLYKRQYYILQDKPVAYCSECGKRMCSRFTSFCPNCGAKMDGGD